MTAAGSAAAASPPPRYRTLGLLGHGGMGRVWLVHDAVREEPVALKRLLRVDALGRIRFKREFRAVERLAHPGLVRLFELEAGSSERLLDEDAGLRGAGPSLRG